MVRSRCPARQRRTVRRCRYPACCGVVQRARNIHGASGAGVLRPGGQVIERERTAQIQNAAVEIDDAALLQLGAVALVGAMFIVPPLTLMIPVALLVKLVGDTVSAPAVTLTVLLLVKVFGLMVKVCPAVLPMIVPL